eukprot:4065774-Pleurochrysis_carterae.AAC.1
MRHSYVPNGPRRCPIACERCSLVSTSYRTSAFSRRSATPLAFLTRELSRPTLCHSFRVSPFSEATPSVAPES